jgi:hypothetical protein
MTVMWIDEKYYNQIRDTSLFALICDVDIIYVSNYCFHSCGSATYQYAVISNFNW